MTVRKFRPTDLKRVYEIESMSFDQSYGIQIFQQLYEMGIGFLVAEEDGYVVGYVMFWLKYENQGHIISLAVDKNYRRRGHATELLAKAIGVLFLITDTIYLEVRASNRGALEFYKQFHFIEDRVVPNYYESGEDAVVLFLKSGRSKVSTQ